MTKKKLSREEFFKKLSALAGVHQIEVIKDVYYSLDRLISRELLERGEISLPDIGKFYVKIDAPRKFHSNRVGVVNLPSMKKMKFQPDYKKKEYFKNA